MIRALIVLIQIRSYVLAVLACIQMVGKGYQQTTKYVTAIYILNFCTIVYMYCINYVLTEYLYK